MHFMVPFFIYIVLVKLNDILVMRLSFLDMVLTVCRAGSEPFSGLHRSVTTEGDERRGKRPVTIQ